uniref:carbonic anhydrase 4-like isoform X2 n=1 Tax=Gasterosteus aculeatus aculeatus TaxID=481459 RepID=UPI001A97EB9A|nr:carbonic anhydrase 4-like isoform X2 [Gasterosteus aculeatus aculeatus]
MHLYSLVSLLFLSLGALVKCAAASDWCYSGCYHSPGQWADLGHPCGGKRQSPIDIVTAEVKTDPHLLNFTFVNFSSPRVIKSIVNDGQTVKCVLENNEVEVSEGGLNGTYSALELHFRWGDDEHHPGSEHTVDGHRYPMEMHVVSPKKGFSVQNAANDSEGIAILAFFINANDNEETLGPWSELTAYLTNGTVAMNHNISIDDLIGNVDPTKFYRYMGSLTIPDCSESVVWTVFQDPINVHTSLVERFPAKTGLTDVHRTTQALNGRSVFASPAVSPPGHSWCHEEEACQYGPSLWHTMPHSYCGAERQSPVDIEAQAAVPDESLGAFSFTNFDDKNAIMYIVNTGHSVKCVLKDDTVEVSGGGLQYNYSTLQFHFHWGSRDTNGSEHKVDSKRYPMEMHIVNKRKDLTLDEALETPNGLAVLGFFIEPKAGDITSSEQTNATSDMEVWRKLTSYVSAVENISSDFMDEISIDDLLGDVNRVEYYRYAGSLTTPSCNEAVAWTVFKESVKVDKDLMMLFPANTNYSSVFRPTQPLHDRIVYTTAAASNAADPADPAAPLLLLLLLTCLCACSRSVRL